jgi:hypothetical protein
LGVLIEIAGLPHALLFELFPLVLEFEKLRQVGFALLA